VRLTQFSNFAIRVLMYAGLKGHRPSAVPEMARAYGVSYDHLKKAAAELCRLGYLETVRGRSGGFRLARAPEEIRIGDVIRRTERDVVLVECFDAATNTCPLLAPCRLRVALGEALAAFFAVLDRYTLADLIGAPNELAPALGLSIGPTDGPAAPPAQSTDSPATDPPATESPPCPEGSSAAATVALANAPVLPLSQPTLTPPCGFKSGM
jgi:Rrf2 family nitric oxide-sensitive transcriptional repressor